MYQASVGIATMSEVRQLIQGSLDRPLVDHTGLTGYYELFLRVDHPLLIQADTGGTTAAAPATRQDETTAMLSAMRISLG